MDKNGAGPSGTRHQGTKGNGNDGGLGKEDDAGDFMDESSDDDNDDDDEED